MPVVTGERAVAHGSSGGSSRSRRSPPRSSCIIDRDAAVAGGSRHARETGLVIGQGDDRICRWISSPSRSTSTGTPPQVFTVSYEVGGSRAATRRGLLIGEVSRVLEATNQLADRVSVRPAVDFSALTFVLSCDARRRSEDAAA